MTFFFLVGRMELFALDREGTDQPKKGVYPSLACQEGEFTEVTHRNLGDSRAATMSGYT